MIFTRRFGTLRARQTFQSVSVTDAEGRENGPVTPESQGTTVAAAGARTSADHKHAA